ncbi:MAG: hypothetical protein J7M11_06590 [Elusimicrobia bacterium]|nr:hypothetical protein [Elusimicrobiota bacterium]
MTARKIKQKAVVRSKYKIYLCKAAEFYQVMCRAEEIEKWHAVGLNGVHCVISACDAVLVFYLGLRSSSGDHRDIIHLLKRTALVDLDKMANVLCRVIDKKNLIEYEDRIFTEKEARELAKLVKRFFNWVSGKVLS